MSPFALLFVTLAGVPLTRAYTLRALDDCLTKAGYSSAEFSGHSFRRGTAFAAAEAGYTPEQIKLLGRWKSDTWKLYVDQPLSVLRDLSASLHRRVPVAPTRPLSTPPIWAPLTIRLPPPGSQHLVAPATPARAPRRSLVSAPSGARAISRTPAPSTVQWNICSPKISLEATLFERN
jgi:hypothetical protein